MILYVIGESGPKHIGVNDNVIGKVDQNMIYLEDDFAGTGSVDLNKWQSPTVGAGMTLTKASGYARIAAGTTAGSITTIRSKKQFIGASILRFTAMLSQRIANQNVFLELTDGINNTYAQWDLSGTVNTTARTGTMNQGNGLQNAATATNATSTFQTFEIQRTEAGIQFSTNTVSTNTISTVRSQMTYGMPELDLPLYVQIRVVNGGTAPASNTNIDIERVSLISANALKVAIEKGAGNQSLLNAVPIAILQTVSVTGSLTSAGTTTNTPATPTASIVNSAATTNATLVKNIAGTVYGVVVSNINAAARFLKLYNLAAAPTVGTSVPAITIPIPAGQVVNVNFGSQGMRYATGISLAITGAAADTDTTAVAASEVKVNISYI
jgi:hypothetical protein